MALTQVLLLGLSGGEGPGHSLGFPFSAFIGTLPEQYLPNVT